jgi:hypothetical protein
MTYIVYIEGGSPPSPSTHSKKPLMTIALPQLTDAQLTEVGFTTGQIKEVRKYLKTPGFQRNAHQRALCRRYSDAQRQVLTVKPDARFTGGKKESVKRQPKVKRVYKRQILDKVQRPEDTLTDRAFAAQQLGLIAASGSFFFSHLLDLENALLKRVPAGELIFNGGNSSARRALQVVETNAAIYDDSVARRSNVQVIRLNEGFAVVQYGASATNLKDGRALLA